MKKQQILLISVILWNVFLSVEYLYSIPSIILEEIIAEESAKAVEVEEEEEKGWYKETRMEN